MGGQGNYGSQSQNKLVEDMIFKRLLLQMQQNPTLAPAEAHGGFQEQQQMFPQAPNTVTSFQSAMKEAIKSTPVHTNQVNQSIHQSFRSPVPNKSEASRYRVPESERYNEENSRPFNENPNQVSNIQSQLFQN